EGQCGGQEGQGRHGAAQGAAPRALARAVEDRHRQDRGSGGGPCVEPAAVTGAPLVSERTFKIWRGDAKGGEFRSYRINVDEGLVVLDVLHRIQAEQAGDLAMRWNCKAGKCGSCSMELNGKPRLACMTRMSTYAAQDTITVQP